MRTLNPYLRSTLSFVTLSLALSSCEVLGITDDPDAEQYRPKFQLAGVVDHGVVLRHGDGPDQVDRYGARDVWVYEAGGTYFMHYDAAGPAGWLAALATSKDLINWEKHGAVLELGGPGAPDSRSASYGVTYFDDGVWHMFYLGTPNASPPPAQVPQIPYMTLKANAASPAGPWTKQPEVVPFQPEPNSYYEVTASPGHIIQHQGEYLQFFSATAPRKGRLMRTVGIARTRDLNGKWSIDPEPILPPEHQIENASLYYEPANGTWFLFTNHVTRAPGGFEYTDAVWVYWSTDLNRWDSNNRALVLDGSRSNWSKRIIGLPSVLKVGHRLALFYDGVERTTMPAGEVESHMGRNVGLAWIQLPLAVPQ